VISYRAYLASPQWDNRRKVEFAKARGTCLACANRAQNIHHRTYARLGREAEGDLVALCENCHLLAHLYHTEHADMGLWNATNALIRQNRELFGLPPVELPEEGSTRHESAKADVVRNRRIRNERTQQRRVQERRERHEQRNAKRTQRRQERRQIAASVTREQALTVNCPTCKATPGQSCLKDSGAPRPRNHLGRLKNYLNQQEGQNDAA
jgi:hypothetical protein